MESCTRFLALCVALVAIVSWDAADVEAQTGPPEVDLVRTAISFMVDRRFPEQSVRLIVVASPSPRAEIESGVAEALDAAIGTEEDHLVCEPGRYPGRERCVLPDDKVLVRYHVRELAEDGAVVVVSLMLATHDGLAHFEGAELRLEPGDGGWEVTSILRMFAS